MTRMEKLSKMKIGTAMLLKKQTGINDAFDDIKEGNYFIEIRLDKDSWQTCKLTPESQKLLQEK